MENITERPTLAVRSGIWLDRIESVYLKALRAILLIVATVLLVFALVYATINLSKVMRSPDSVSEKPSMVSSAELMGADAASPAAGATNRAGNSLNQQQRSFYDTFVKRYFGIYKDRYERSLRPDDKKLTIGEFDDLTINSAARLEAIAKGDLDFAVDKTDLETYLPVIEQASASKATTDRLAKYRLATKKPTASRIQRTRKESRRGWDTYSQSCSNWYESPIGCAVTRQVDVPYTETVRVMRYPDGIASPNEILKSYQDRYFALLAERRQSNAEQAATERQDIVAGQTDGWSGLWQSILVVGAFLTLMFFFLLVAIERHQRRISAALP